MAAPPPPGGGGGGGGTAGVGQNYGLLPPPSVSGAPHPQPTGLGESYV